MKFPVQLEATGTLGPHRNLSSLAYIYQWSQYNNLFYMVSTTSASKKQFNRQVQRAYAGLDDILHICPIYKFIVFHLGNWKFGQTGKRSFAKIATQQATLCSWIFNTTYALSHRICFSPSKNEFWPLSSFLLFPLFFLFLCSVHTVGTWLFSLFQLLQLHRQCLCLLASPSRQRRRH